MAPTDGRGGTFPCHKTVNQESRDERSELECAGALIFAYKLDASTQLTRISERLGLIDQDLADGEHPEIFDSVDDLLATACDREQVVKRPQRKAKAARTVRR